MNRAALMQRIEQHFGAKAVTRAADLAVLLEDICCQVYQWGREDDGRVAAPAAPVPEPQVGTIGHTGEVTPAVLDACAVVALAAQSQPVAEQGELPPLPPHPEAQVMRWSELEQKALRDYARAAIAASQQAKEIDHGNIFDLIREWAHLPEGQRHDAARAIIGRMNQSYAAGVADGKVLGAASQQAAEPVAKFYARAVDMNQKGSWFVIVSPRNDSEWNVPLYAAPAIQQPQDERAAFQAEMQRHGYNMAKEAADPTDYAFPAMRAAWRAWRARAAFGKTCNCTKGASHG